MPLFINTSVPSLTPQRKPGKAAEVKETSFSRLASGVRVDTAKADPVNLNNSAGLMTKMRGLNQHMRQANDGISITQVAEDALNETRGSLQSIRNLAEQATDDTTSATDRQEIGAKIAQEVSHVERVATQTQYNQKNLLDGTYQENFQVGGSPDEAIQLSIPSTSAKALGLDAVGVASPENANETLAIVDNAMTHVDTVRSGVNDVQDQFKSTIAKIANESENLKAAHSMTLDPNAVGETAQLTKSSVLEQANTGILAQANQLPQLALQLLG